MQCIRSNGQLLRTRVSSCRWYHGNDNGSDCRSVSASNKLSEILGKTRKTKSLRAIEQLFGLGTCRKAKITAPSRHPLRIAYQSIFAKKQGTSCMRTSLETIWHCNIIFQNKLIVYSLRNDAYMIYPEQKAACRPIPCLCKLTQAFSPAIGSNKSN